MKKTMKKKELLEKIATTAGITSSQAEKALDALLTEIRSQLIEGHRVHASGLGTFAIAKVKRGRNPKTGKVVHAESKQPITTFKAAGTLLKSIK